MSFESIVIVLLTAVFAIYFSYSVYSYFCNSQVERKSLKWLREQGVIFLISGALQILFGYTGVMNKLYILIGILFFLFGLFCFYQHKNEKNT